MSSTYSVYDIKIDNSLSFTPGPTAGYVLAINTDGSTFWTQGLAGSGATGPTGATGPQGEIGPTGADGADGADGATGATGASGVTQSLFEVYITGTTASYLIEEANWPTGATYGGTAISGTYQGQKYYSDDFLYEAVADNEWVRYELDRKTPFLTLTDAATINWNYKLGYNAKVTLAGDRSLSITGAESGDYGTLFVIQDSATQRRINFGAGDKFAGGTYSFSSGTGAVDIFTWLYDGTNYYYNFNKSFE